MEQAKNEFTDPIYLKTQTPVDHMFFYSHVALQSQEI